MENMPGSAPASVKRLAQMLKDADECVRIFAALRLGSLGAEAQAAVPVLVDLLGSSNIIDRRIAALALGKIGPSAREAVPLLLRGYPEHQHQLYQRLTESGLDTIS